MRSRFLSAAIMFAAACGAHPTHATERTIAGLPNIEDMVATPDQSWVIASSMVGGTQAKGALYLVDARTSTPVRIALTAAEGTSRCPGGFQPDSLAPHGLALRSEGDESVLYVVNHGGRESIERFRIKTQGPTLSVRWEDCIPLPKGAFANSVAAADDGTIFITNMGQAFKAKEDVAGDLLIWSAGSGWQALPGSQRPGWNGIVVTKDGSRVYAAAWPDRKVVEFIRGRSGPARSVTVDFLPDNLHWADDGAIIVAGQDAAARAVTDCFFSAATACGLSSGFARLDPERMKLPCVHKLRASDDFNTATTGIAVGDALWLGTMRGQSIRVTGTCATKAPVKSGE